MKLILIIIALLLIGAATRIEDRSGCGCFGFIAGAIAILAYCILV